MGVTISTTPLKIVRQRKRYSGQADLPEASFEVGDVVDFEADGRRALAVRHRSFDGAIEFSGLRDWAPGRGGIVTQVAAAPYKGATIVDLPSGEQVSREQDHPSLKVGDLVRYDLMSDFVALELERVDPKRQP